MRIGMKKRVTLVILTLLLFLLATVAENQPKNQMMIKLSSNSERAILDQNKQLNPIAGATLAMAENMRPKEDKLDIQYPVAGINLEIAKMIDEVDLSKRSVNNNTDIKEIETTEPDIQPIDNMLYFTTSVVNVRSGPGKQYDVEMIISDNQLVTVIGCFDGWYLLSENGWINGDLLEEFHEELYMADTSLMYTTQLVINECLETMNLDAEPWDVYGLIWTESRGIRTTVGADGDSGYMQIIPSTWNNCYKMCKQDFPELSAKYLVDDPFDANSNVLIGCYVIYRIMHEIGVDSYQNNKSRVLTSYNRGVGNANAYFEKHGTYSTEYSVSVISNGNYIKEHNTWEGI